MEQPLATCDADVAIRPYCEEDVPAMAAVWNQVVEAGNAFPQEETLDVSGAVRFFAEQSHCGIAVDKQDGRVLGLYILHPNNVGRCSHVANASYAVNASARGRHIGEKLVRDSIAQCGKLGYSGLQFNAVVDSNVGARHLYERIGFTHMCRIPNGFRMADGTFQDTHVYFIETPRS